jgi:hypothetical protein
MQILFKNVRMTWLRVSSFHNLGKSALAFYSLHAREIAQKNNRNSNSSNNNDYNNNNQEQVSEEEYLTDHQYEEERFTDDNAYSEDFRDDYNKADRFPS